MSQQHTTLQSQMYSLIIIVVAALLIVMSVILVTRKDLPELDLSEPPTLIYEFGDDMQQTTP